MSKARPTLAPDGVWKTSCNGASTGSDGSGVRALEGAISAARPLAGGVAGSFIGRATPLSSRGADCIDAARCDAPSGTGSLPHTSQKIQAAPATKHTIANNAAFEL